MGDHSETILWMNLSLQPSDFTQLSEPHPKTKDLGKDGTAIFRGDLSRERLETFITSVCKWGGYPGIATRVIKNNSYDEIRSAFQSAVNALSQADADPGDALCEINKLYGLGKPSFASKHLRFLRPEICPVFDSIIDENSKYLYDEHGYRWFAQDCLKIAACLERLGIPNTMKRPNGRWYAADVEVALYRYLKHENTCAG